MSRDDPARPSTLTWLVGIVASACIVWLLRAAAIVVIPVATAFFITIVIYPVQLFLRDRVPRPRWAALAATMALLVALVGGAVWAIAESVDEAAEAAPQYAGRLQQLWTTAEESARANGLPIPTNVLGSSDAQQRLTRLATAAAGTAWEIASGLVLVFFLVLLMLLEAPIWNQNTRRVLRDGHGSAAIETVTSIAAGVRQYLYVRTVLGLASAAAAAVWLLILDVDLVLVWVTLTFALNYIPNFGSIIAVFPPSLMALVQHGPMHGLITLAGLTLFEQIIGNFIDPRIQGRRLQISPVVVLVALVFWTWLWGPVGALLAVPMTVTMLAAAAHVPALRPFTTLLAAQRDPSSPAGRRHAA